MKLNKTRKQLQQEIDQLRLALFNRQNQWPEKCPITRRDFFMEIDGVPTYGGPYDSYTIHWGRYEPEDMFNLMKWDLDRGWK